MLVKAFQFDGFRNLASTFVEPSPRFNVVWGDNGQGKTNLLEALYVCSTLRSFRTQKVTDLLRLGEGCARLRAVVQREGVMRRYDVALSRSGKEVKLDDKVPRPLASYFGAFNAVLFVPEDLGVPKGAPGDRRRFLDRAVFQREPQHLPVSQRYLRVLKSRNRLLKDGVSDTRLLDGYDEQLAALGIRIEASRREYLRELEPFFAQAFAAISGGGRPVGLEYQGGELPLAGALAKRRSVDLARRQTTVGPHVDDIDFRIDGQSARTFASQGQLRALVLAWKIGEVRLIRERTGESPILLLDDVSSELDPTKSRYLFEFLRSTEGQCFVTTTHPSYVQVSENRLEFHVVDGVIQGGKTIAQPPFTC